MPAYRLTYTIDAPMMTKDELKVEAAFAGQALHQRNGVNASWKIVVVKGKRRSWVVTYKGDRAPGYNICNSKAQAQRALKVIRGERWAHDPQDYQIQLLSQVRTHA